jgi:DMSO reductase anchor subunit
MSYPLLTGFTLVGQLAVGAFWVLLETDLISAPHFDTSHVEGIRLAPLLMVFTTMSLSMGVGMALQHLESPQLACLAIMNIRTSWLSREIVRG